MSKMKELAIDRTNAGYRIDEWSRIFSDWAEAYRAETINEAVSWGNVLLDQRISARVINLETGRIPWEVNL